MKMGIKARRLLMLSMLALLVARLFHTALVKSATFDEPGQIAAGYRYLTDGDFRTNAEHPPFLKLLSASPLAILGADKAAIERLPGARPDPLTLARAGAAFLHGSGLGYRRTLLAARLPIMALALVGGLGVYFWTKELFGPGGALFSLFLYTFSPEILAHGSLAATDLGAAALMIVSAWLFWRLLVAPGYFNLTAAGIAFGLSLGSKFTSLLLIPVFAAEALAVAAAGKAADRSKTGGATRLSGRGMVLWLAGFFAIAAAVLAAVYKFDQSTVFFEGLRLQWRHAAAGHPAFLNGSISNEGWPHFFLAAFALKTPLAFMALLFLRVVSTIRAGSDARFSDFFLLLPAAAILMAASLGRFNMGLRLILPVYPFLFAYAGGLFDKGQKGFMRGWRTWVVLALGLWYAASSLAAHPDYLAYFNELAGGAEKRSLRLVDSNLDWGQDLTGLKRFMKRNGISRIYLSYFGTDSPEAHGIAYMPLPPMSPGACSFPRSEKADFIVVSATYLRGLYLRDSHLYSWLADRRPAAVIGGSIFIFDLRSDPDARSAIDRICGKLSLHKAEAD